MNNQEINKNVVDNISVNSQILIVTDIFAEYEIIYDQKLVFLLKKLKIIIDCLHISDSINVINCYNLQYYIQSIANYSGGLYETINTAKLMQQKLLVYRYFNLAKLFNIPSGTKDYEVTFNEFNK